jgi:hypothetical protein
MQYNFDIGSNVRSYGFIREQRLSRPRRNIKGGEKRC